MFKKSAIAILTAIIILNTVAASYAAETPFGPISEPSVNQPANSPFNTNPAQAQPSENVFKQDKQQPQVENVQVKESGNPYNQSLLNSPNNPIGLAYPFKQLEQSTELLKKNDIGGAKKIVEPLSEWLTDMTEYHIALFKKLNTIDTAKESAQIEKRIALDSALLRDKAYYQLALIYIAEKDMKKAIKYLVDIVKSQPTTELGIKSYEILQQIGFTEKVKLVK